MLELASQLVYAVVYYTVAATVVTVVLTARAAPHVGRAARWTGRNTLTGAQKLEARIRAQRPWYAQRTKAGSSPDAAVSQVAARNRAKSHPHRERLLAGAEYTGDRRVTTIPARTWQTEEYKQAKDKANKARPPAAAVPAQKSSSPPSSASPTARTESSSTGGSDMSNRNGNGANGVPDAELFRRAKQAIRPVAQLEPETAWDLDFHFQAQADLILFVAEVLSVYGETLDRRVGVDPRLVRQYLESVEGLTGAVQKLHQTRRRYREMYRAAFEAAESGRVRMPSKPNFWSTGGRR